MLVFSDRAVYVQALIKIVMSCKVVPDDCESILPLFRSIQSQGYQTPPTSTIVRTESTDVQ